MHNQTGPSSATRHMYSVNIHAPPLCILHALYAFSRPCMNSKRHAAMPAPPTGPPGKRTGCDWQNGIGLGTRVPPALGRPHGDEVVQPETTRETPHVPWERRSPRGETAGRLTSCRAPHHPCPCQSKQKLATPPRRKPATAPPRLPAPPSRHRPAPRPSHGLVLPPLHKLTPPNRRRRQAAHTQKVSSTITPLAAATQFR